MRPEEAFRTLVRIAVESEGDTKLALLDIAASLGGEIGFPAEAMITANIAAQLRTAGDQEDNLISFLEGK